MVQVHQANPEQPQGFLSGLSQGLNEGLQNYFQMKEQRKQMEGLTPILQSLGLEKEGIDQILGSGISAKELEPYAKLLQQSQAKKAQESSGISTEDYENILDQLDETLDRGEAGLMNYLQGFLPGPLGEQARFTGSKFRSLGTATLGLAQQVALKQGIRNQKEFQAFLDRTVPNEHDTVATAKGKVAALRSYLSGKQFEGSSSKSQEKKGGQLTKEQATKFLRQAKGNKEQARKLAREQGYEF